MTLERFVKTTLDLLDKERQAEVDETRILTEKLPPKELQRRGVCLLKLHIIGRRSGLYGRTVVTFEPFWPGNDLPSHNLTPGDIVGLTLSQGEMQNETLASGIVSKVAQSYISVAFDELHDIFSLDDEEKYKLTKLANDITYRRLKRTLNDLNKYISGPASMTIGVLFGTSDLSPPFDKTDLVFSNENLNDSQREAVEFSLHQRELAVIHGPPGTGKTTTVVEVIIQSVKQGLKVLACAPSNVAVDNLVEKLFKERLKRIVRIGHPARLLPHVQQFSLDAIVSCSEEAKLVQDVRKDIDNVIVKIKKSRHRGEKQGLREEMRHLRRELVDREKAATREILKRADVVLVTLTSASDTGPVKLLEEDHFNLVVIDECSQALEAACWIGLLRAPRCVLAGDHHQLPPTILSHEAAKAGLEVTLMERILKDHGNSVVRMLTTQYRMNELIMQWASDQLYGGKLTAHDSVRTHLLKDLPDVEDCEETSCPLLLIDTAGCDLFELELPEEVSKGNEGEADIVEAHVEKLISSGLQAVDIGVIAPYNLQVDLLRIRLSQKYPKLEIKSVDGFQGREKEAIVISMVRSNPKGEVGFLAENRRINVAVTRARRHTAVICDTETIRHDNFLKSLVDYISEKGEVWSAQEYIQAGNVSHIGARPEQLENLLFVKTKNKIGKKDGKTKKPKKQMEKKEIMPSSAVKSAQKDSTRTDQDDRAEKEAKFAKYLEDFVANKTKMSFDFPASLNSHDRLIVHELSEKLGLVHISMGEGKERHMVVSKPGYHYSGLSTSGDERSHISQPEVDEPVDERSEVALPEVETSEVVQLVVERSEVAQPIVEKSKVTKPGGDRLEVTSHGSKSSESNASDTEIRVASPDVSDGFCNPDKMDFNTATIKSVDERTTTKKGSQSIKKSVTDETEKCRHCGKNVLRSNSQLHELHCSRQSKPVYQTTGQGAKPKKPDPKPQVKAVKSKKDTFANKTAAELDKVDPDDFDALIATVQKIDNVCAFKKCKQFTTTLGHTCQFCCRRFCLAHHIPEAHGCGDQAKMAARQTVIKEGIIFRGNTAPDRKLDPAKRAGLQRKLEKKLGDMASKRNTKKDAKK